MPAAIELKNARRPSTCRERLNSARGTLTRSRINGEKALDYAKKEKRKKFAPIIAMALGLSLLDKKKNIKKITSLYPRRVEDGETRRRRRPNLHLGN